MDKKMLQKAFREYKKATATAGMGIDYAITNPDSLGDCMSCVNDALCEKYGEESKGIWVKEWTRGMNAGDGIESLDTVYIAHDITEAQAAMLYSVLGEYYNILPAQYDRGKCFNLYEKGQTVWQVSYKDEWQGSVHEYSDEYTNLDEAMRRVKNLCGYETVFGIRIDRMF